MKIDENFLNSLCESDDALFFSSIFTTEGKSEAFICYVIKGSQ